MVGALILARYIWVLVLASITTGSTNQILRGRLRSSDRLSRCHGLFGDWLVAIVGRLTGWLYYTSAKLGYPTMRLADVDSTLGPYDYAVGRL